MGAEGGMMKEHGQKFPWCTKFCFGAHHPLLVPFLCPFKKK